MNNTNSQSAKTKNGDINQYNIGNVNLQNSRPLTKTKILELLKVFQSRETEHDFNTEELPSELNRKLIFNNAQKFIKMFENNFIDYIYLDNVIKNDFPNSQQIIQRLKDLFYDLPEVSYDFCGNVIVKDGSAALSSLSTRLYDIIINDINLKSLDVYEEDIRRFIMAFLAYGVTECQVLLNPNQEKEK